MVGNICLYEVAKPGACICCQYQKSPRGLENIGDKFLGKRGEIPDGYHLLCSIDIGNEEDTEDVCGWRFYSDKYGPDCTAAGCMRAGNDVVMPGCADDQVNLSTELASGSLKKADLEACVSRLVRCVLQSNEYVE